MSCSHLWYINDIEPRSAVCEECKRTGDTWVHLIVCSTCGYVGCCDSSKNRHASKHFQKTDHPVISMLADKTYWRWCYIDREFIW